MQTLKHRAPVKHRRTHIIEHGFEFGLQVPVLACVKMRRGEELSWTFTALFYNDELRRTAEGWRITRRYEELVFPDGAEPGRA